MQQPVGPATAVCIILTSLFGDRIFPAPPHALSSDVERAWNESSPALSYDGETARYNESSTAVDSIRNLVTLCSAVDISLCLAPVVLACMAHARARGYRAGLKMEKTLTVEQDEGRLQATAAAEPMKGMEEKCSTQDDAHDRSLPQKRNEEPPESCPSVCEWAEVEEAAAAKQQEFREPDEEVAVALEEGAKTLETKRAESDEKAAAAALKAQETTRRDSSTEASAFEELHPVASETAVATTDRPCTISHPVGEITRRGNEGEAHEELASTQEEGDPETEHPSVMKADGKTEDAIPVWLEASPADQAGGDHNQGGGEKLATLAVESDAQTEALSRGLREDCVAVESSPSTRSEALHVLEAEGESKAAVAEDASLEAEHPKTEENDSAQAAGSSPAVECASPPSREARIPSLKLGGSSGSKHKAATAEAAGSRLEAKFSGEAVAQGKAGPRTPRELQKALLLATPPRTPRRSLGLRTSDPRSPQNDSAAGGRQRLPLHVPRAEPNHKGAASSTASMDKDSTAQRAPASKHETADRGARLARPQEAEDVAQGMKARSEASPLAAVPDADIDAEIKECAGSMWALKDKMKQEGISGKDLNKNAEILKFVAKFQGLQDEKRRRKKAVGISSDSPVSPTSPGL